MHWDSINSKVTYQVDAFTVDVGNPAISYLFGHDELVVPSRHHAHRRKR